MASLPQRAKVHDPIRGCFVTATPEEIIRQHLVKEMVEEWGFPKSLLAIEKELASLPHLASLPQSHIPKRRVDIIAFANDIHKSYPLYPLIMIECKAVPLTPAVIQQVVGYNEVVKAPYLAVANKEKTLLGHFNTRDGLFRFEEGFLSYSQLITQLHTS